MGRNHADLILQGGKIVDVHSGLIQEGDIIVTGHRIVGLLRPQSVICRLEY
jgi:adenine deaminase